MGACFCQLEAWRAYMNLLIRQMTWNFTLNINFNASKQDRIHGSWCLRTIQFWWPYTISPIPCDLMVLRGTPYMKTFEISLIHACESPSLQKRHRPSYHALIPAWHETICSRSSFFSIVTKARYKVSVYNSVNLICLTSEDIQNSVYNRFSKRLGQAKLWMKRVRSWFLTFNFVRLIIGDINWKCICLCIIIYTRNEHWTENLLYGVHKKFPVTSIVSSTPWRALQTHSHSLWVWKFSRKN